MGVRCGKQAHGYLGRRERYVPHFDILVLAEGLQDVLARYTH